ncbi:TadE/TadG family type IV pilus assembly protein [Kribbella sp. CA-253562]|uniref:TadE/TadG family type IV pilus assembly protein n=1 Tax=Kribbella sp. CA-253562 TaxID=3239942 RepID=UPI003D8B1AAF
MARTPDPAGRRAARASARLTAWFRIDAPSNDRGALSPAVVILALMIFTLAGLVIDGGRQLGARSRAVGYAQEAARAGVGTIDFNSAEARIDITKAADAVGAFCAKVTENDPAVTACAASELDAEHLKVQVQIDNKTSFLGLVGIQNLTARGEGEAHAEQGIVKADETPQIPPIVLQTTPDEPGVTVRPTAEPPPIDFPCPEWTIGSPTPPWTPPIPIPFPATCTASITPSPTDSPSETPPDSTSPTPTPTPPSSPPSGGGGG